MNHTVQLLEVALAVARSAGYEVRMEWLGGQTGGACEVAGRRWLFVDLALSPAEQLEQVVVALRGLGIDLESQLRAHATRHAATARRAA
jgi:hypothetical protein